MLVLVDLLREIRQLAEDDIAQATVRQQPGLA
jgi:hypothetical protein